MNDTQKQAAWLVEMYQHKADGGELEYRDCIGDWKTSHEGPTMGSLPENWRKKRCTININGHEVPEPVRGPLKMRELYYVPNPAYATRYSAIQWTSSDSDKRRLNDGLIHATQEAAIAHAEALISFTRMEVSDGMH